MLMSKFVSSKCYQSRIKCLNFMLDWLMISFLIFVNQINMIKNLTKLGNCFHNGFIRNLPSLVIYLLIFVWLGVVFSCVSDYKSVYIDLFIHRHAKNRPSWSSNSGCRCSKSFNNSRSFNSSSNIFLVNKSTSPFRCSSSIHLFYLLQHS